MIFVHLGLNVSSWILSASSFLMDMRNYVQFNLLFGYLCVLSKQQQRNKSLNKRESRKYAKQ